MNNIIESLATLDKQIENAKRNIAIQEGRMKETIQQLKNEFGLDNIEDAIKQEAQETIDLETLAQNIKVKFSELRNQYEW